MLLLDFPHINLDPWSINAQPHRWSNHAGIFFPYFEPPNTWFFPKQQLWFNIHKSKSPGLESDLGSPRSLKKTLGWAGVVGFFFPHSFSKSLFFNKIVASQKTNFLWMSKQDVFDNLRTFKEHFFCFLFETGNSSESPFLQMVSVVTKLPLSDRAWGIFFIQKDATRKNFWKTHPAFSVLKVGVESP